MNSCQRSESSFEVNFRTTAPLSPRGAPDRSPAFVVSSSTLSVSSSQSTGSRLNAMVTWRSSAGNVVSNPASFAHLINSSAFFKLRETYKVFSAAMRCAHLGKRKTTQERMASRLARYAPREKSVFRGYDG